MTTLTLARPSHAQTERTSIEQTVHQFVKATSDRDVHGMHYLLHENFQVLESAGVMSKSGYMKALADRKLGGMAENAEVLYLDITDTAASVKVRIVRGHEKNELFIHLLKSTLGSWQILHLLPYGRVKI